MRSFKECEYSVRQLDSARKLSAEKFSVVPKAVPIDMKIPETANQAIARILYNTGSLNQEQYFKVNGLVFDGDFKDEDEDFEDDGFFEDDEFEQSSLSEYIDGVRMQATAISEPRPSDSPTPKQNNGEVQTQETKNGGDKDVQ